MLLQVYFCFTMNLFLYFIVQIVFFLDVDECESSPCLNGATCDNSPGNFSCICTDFWIGPNCEIGTRNTLWCIHVPLSLCMRIIYIN